MLVFQVLHLDKSFYFVVFSSSNTHSLLSLILWRFPPSEVIYNLVVRILFGLVQPDLDPVSGCLALICLTALPPLASPHLSQSRYRLDSGSTTIWI